MGGEFAQVAHLEGANADAAARSPGAAIAPCLKDARAYRLMRPSWTEPETRSRCPLGVAVGRVMYRQVRSIQEDDEAWPFGLHVAKHDCMVPSCWNKCRAASAVGPPVLRLAKVLVVTCCTLLSEARAARLLLFAGLMLAREYA